MSPQQLERAGDKALLLGKTSKLSTTVTAKQQPDGPPDPAPQQWIVHAMLVHGQVD